ncbi:sugar phosphate nucleotidyltransferase [Campylobacter phage DA10]|nr:sugar phosphate nucleotidyltransferase [Campylobacter phage DA10]
MTNLRDVFKEKDEYYTPFLLIEFLLPILKEKNIKTILCPFDNESSKYVRFFKERGLNVINGHINDGKDFFSEWWLNYEFDILISNPPFSKKKEIIEVATKYNIDFMLLMNLMTINYQDFSEVLRLSDKQKPINFIIPNKKVSFDGNTTSFSSGYICNCIEKNLFIDLPHNNTNKNFNKDN